MTRKTSIEAYNAVLHSGMVGNRHKEIYRIIYAHGPMTANECFNMLAKGLGDDFRFDSNTRSRLTELRERGLLQELGTRPCTVTKRKCILWDVTDECPSKLEPKKTKDQIIQELQKQIDTLKADRDRLLGKLPQGKQNQLRLFE